MVMTFPQSPTQQFIDVEADIAGNLSQRRRGDVAPGMKGDRRATSIGMSEPLVGATVADLNEAAPHLSMVRSPGYATWILRTPRNSDSSAGSPSSRSISMTS